MIAAPLNDRACLGPTTELIISELEAGNPAIVELAERFKNTDELAAWFRTLPQRDDDGIPGEGPKVSACRPPQRLQFDNPSPNCFERSARWVGAAELIDPDCVYRLSTIETPNGLHTFPTRDGVPVILDPAGTRNTPSRVVPGVDDETRGVRGDLARARKAKELGHTTWVDGEPIDDAIARYELGLAHFRAQLAALPPRNVRNSGSADPFVLTPSEAIDWIGELANVHAESMPDGSRRVARGHRAMRGALEQQPIRLADVRDVAFVLALAEREARAYGLAGLKVVHSTMRAIDALDRLAAQRVTAPIRNNPLAALGALFDPRGLVPWIGAVTRVGSRIAGGIGLEALKLKLAKVGVSPPLIAAFEKELNREGLSLGTLAKPSPMVGSLDAMTPQALGGRWLAQKL